MDIIYFLQESGFNDDYDGFIKSKQIPFGYDNVNVVLKINTSNFKYKFSVHISSPVFMVTVEKDKRINSLNWTPEIINCYFEDLIKEAFDALAKDVVHKVLPIQDRF